MPPRSVNARWFAVEGTAAAWAQALVLQHSLEDVEAAYSADDWPTCVDCAFEAVVGAAYVVAVSEGWLGPPSEPDVLVRLATSASPFADLLAALPPAAGAGPATADRAREVVGRACALADAAVPLHMEGFRTPAGFYPGVRVAKDLEKLRARMGVPGFGWAHWMT